MPDFPVLLGKRPYCPSGADGFYAISGFLSRRSAYLQETCNSGIHRAAEEVVKLSNFLWI